MSEGLVLLVMSCLPVLGYIQVAGRADRKGDSLTLRRTGTLMIVIVVSELNYYLVRDGVWVVQCL